jgi:hypothetical protein
MSGDSLTIARARLGGLMRAATYDGVEVTAAARRTFRDSFRDGHACKVCPPTTLPVELAETERARRAEALRLSHYARIRLARMTRKAPAPAKADASEVRRDDANTTSRV